MKQNAMKILSFPSLTRAVVLVTMSWCFCTNNPSCTVTAHGYITISRNKKCQEGSNIDCGNIVYEPQSLEAPKGFPGAGPADGKIASAGLASFSKLDQQSLDQWHKTNVQQGPFRFIWNFTANHLTTGFQYYITKSGWNPNAPLTRAQFGSAPFCSFTLGGNQPIPKEGYAHSSCNLPARTGYQIILAVWTIHDTANAFYNVVDVQYGIPAPTTTTAPLAAPVASPSPVVSFRTSVCGSGKPLAAVEGCTAFVHCVGGKPIPNSKTGCPTGLLFNSAAQVCDWPSNVNCL